MTDVNVKRGMGKGQKQPKVIVNDFTQVAPNRNRKDIGKLKSSIERAESIHLPNRTQLYDLYHDIVTIDGHLSGIIRKRKDSILNKSLQFVDKNKRKVDKFDKLIYSNKFRRLIELILDSRFWGISGFEFIVGDKFDFVEIPRKHIRPEKGIIVKSQYDNTGIPVDGLPYVWLVGESDDLGLLLTCSMYALYKRAGFGDFAQYVEIFGQPVRIIYYDAYDTKTKEELRKMLFESGGSLVMMVPKQAQFQMLDGKTSNGTGELQTRLINTCNDEMSVAILGNTETTTSSSSSGYAQSLTQSKQQLEITKSDLLFVENILNEEWFMNILRMYGYPVGEGSFEYEKELDIDELLKRKEVDEFVASKVPIDDDYWYTTYGIPRPDNYDELKAIQEESRKAAIEISRNTNKPEDEKDWEKTPSETSSKIESEKTVAITKKEKNLLSPFIDFFFGKKQIIDLADYYSQTCPCCDRSAGLLPDLTGGNRDNIYEDIARKLLNDQLQKGTIPDSLYFETATRLMGGINKGLEGTSFNFDDKRNILKSYLTRNIYHFSAAKSLTELLEYRNMMYDKKTKEILSFSEFKRRLNEKGKLFSEVWLKTEYDTALQSSIMAMKWETINAEYLEYRTVGDNRVRPDHALLDKKTYPKEHPFWNKAYPPLAYNCRCTVIPGIAKNYKPEMSDEDERYAGGLVKDTIFDQNVGKTRLAFDDNHPYYVNLPDKVLKELNYKNYGLPTIESIYDKWELNPIEVLNTMDDYEAYWNAMLNTNKGISLTDPIGQTILFPDYDLTKTGRPKDNFKQHIISRKNDPDRYKLIPNISDIIKRPDEIWSVYRGGIKPLTTHYVKYYEGKTLLVIADENKAKTMFDLTKTGYKTRQGLLLYRKTRKPR